MSKKDKDLWKAYDAISRALDRWPENENLEEVHVKFVGKHRSMFPDDVDLLLGKMEDQLADSGEHWNRVASYIEHIVIPWGDPSHHRQAGVALKAWLEKNDNHPKVTALWVTYLTLITKKLPLQISRVGRQCMQWLSTHRSHVGYAHLGHAYGMHVANSRDKHAIEEMLTELLAWLSEHPQNGHLWDCCLSLANNPLSQKDRLEEILSMLLGEPGVGASNSDGMLSTIHSAGTIVSLISVFKSRPNSKAFDLQERMEGFIGSVVRWLEAHPDDKHARRNFLDFVCGYGTAEQAGMVISTHENWIRENQSEESVIASHVRLKEKFGMQGSFDD